MAPVIFQVVLFVLIALVFTQMGYRWGKSDGWKDGNDAGYERGYGISFQQGHSKGLDDARSYTSVYPSAKDMIQSANAEGSQPAKTAVGSAKD